MKHVPGYVGGQVALKYAVRDLPNLEQVIALTPRCRLCVQAGGNLGVWPKRLAQAFETVITFEPAAENFAALCQNAPEPNIVKIQAAIGAQAGLVGLSRVRRDGKPHSHEGITHIDGPGSVPVLRLDDLGLPVCDLLYLDIEGYELYALQGAAATIARCRPVIATEINKSAAFFGLTPEDVQAEVIRHGYREQAVYGRDHVFVPQEWA